MSTPAHLRPTLRPARPGDAEAMAGVQNALFAAGQRRAETDPVRVRAQYLDDPARLACTVALDAQGRVIGFQSLKRAMPGDPYDLPQNTPDIWGVIGTHIAPEAQGRGLGRALFAISHKAAKEAGLSRIDATIGAENTGGLAYYAAMGFREWRRLPDAIGKVFALR